MNKAFKRLKRDLKYGPYVVRFFADSEAVGKLQVALMSSFYYILCQRVALEVEQSLCLVIGNVSLLFLLTKKHCFVETIREDDPMDQSHHLLVRSPFPQGNSDSKYTR